MANRRSLPLVRAAGGVVWREVDGQLRIAVVHRPRYDDWSLPKGKLDVGERALSAAVREVHEEIGAQVTASRRLRTVEYPIEGARKVVDFWTMRFLEGDFAPSKEIDELVWLSVDAARERLSHDIYHEVLDDFCATPVPNGLIALVRHAKAGKRSDWTGDDRDRPLERLGRQQADRLAEFLSYFGPERIVSADRARCVQTAEPLSGRTGVPVEVAPTFSDESYLEHPDRTLRDLLALGKPASTAVVISQGAAIPGLISALPIQRPPADVTTRKGAVWILCFAEPTSLSADRYDGAAR